MPGSSQCATCGAPLSHGAVEENCPACLLKLGLETAGTEPLQTRQSTDDPLRIGPYRILQRVGEGGMGVVYLAEQERPLQRRVALKVIKLGMESREILARFDTERQALARMDHANIASVFDAGV